MDSCIAPFKELAYSFYLADIHTYIIDAEECKQTNSLRTRTQVGLKVRISTIHNVYYLFIQKYCKFLIYAKLQLIMSHTIKS